ncbi:hypothetical protein RFI_07089, partial [Reticulomyxa filosa]
MMKQIGFYISCGEKKEKENSHKTIMDYCSEHLQNHGYSHSLFLRLNYLIYYEAKLCIQVAFQETVLEEFDHHEIQHTKSPSYDLRSWSNVDETEKISPIDGHSTKRQSTQRRPTQERYIALPQQGRTARVVNHEVLVTFKWKYAERFFLLREAVLENYLLKDIPPIPQKKSKPENDISPLDSENETTSVNANKSEDDNDNEEMLVYKIQLPSKFTSSSALELLSNVLERQDITLTADQLNELDNCYHKTCFVLFCFVAEMMIIRLGMSHAFNEYLLYTMVAREKIERSEEERGRACLVIREYKHFETHKLNISLTPFKQWRVFTIDLEHLQIFG